MPWSRPEPLDDSPHSRHSPAPPGMSGKREVLQRSCRPDRWFSQVSGAATPAELLRRLRLRDQTLGGPVSTHVTNDVALQFLAAPGTRRRWSKLKEWLA